MIADSNGCGGDDILVLVLLFLFYFICFGFFNGFLYFCWKGCFCLFAVFVVGFLWRGQFLGDYFLLQLLG